MSTNLESEDLNLSDSAYFGYLYLFFLTFNGFNGQMLILNFHFDLK